MKNKSFIIFIILFLIYCISQFPYWFEESTSNPFDYARITDIEYKAVLFDSVDNNKLVVTERLTYDIHAAYEDNLFWELWRDLPEDYIDGIQVEYKINSVKQILEDGSELTYTESPRLYWDDYDYINTAGGLGPGKWYYSKGPYNEYLRDYECLLIYVDGLYREKVTFEIEYEMYNVAARYNDCSELYLSFYSGDTTKYLKSFKGQILIPYKDMPITGTYEAYTYGTNSHSFPFTESKYINSGYHTFSFELDESDLKFKPYNQFIEFDLISYGIDKHIFTDFAPSNLYSDDNVLEELRQEQEEYEAEPENRKDSKIDILLKCLGISTILILYCIFKKKLMKKAHIFYKPTQKIDYYSKVPNDLDPIFAAELVFCKEKSSKHIENRYSALLLSLVQKGYIELAKIKEEYDWTFNNIKIVVKNKPLDFIPPEMIEFYPNDIEALEPLSKSEELYYNLITRYTAYKSEIPLRVFQSNIYMDYENTDSFVRNLEHSIINIGISEGYFQKADYKEPQHQLKGMSKFLATVGALILTLGNFIIYYSNLDFAFGGLFILGITSIISSLYLKRMANKYVLLTQFGEDEYEKWRGFYNFLNSEQLNECTEIDLQQWEKYLVYATAFGITNKVTEALKLKCSVDDLTPMLQNPYYSSRRFHIYNRHFRNSVRSASRIAHHHRMNARRIWRIRIRRRWPRRWRWPEEVINTQ